MQEGERKTGRGGLRAPTMEGAAEAAPAPDGSPPCGPLSASASACRPPTPLPAPPNLTDPRWPPVGFLCCLRMPEVTAPRLPGFGQSARPRPPARPLLLGATRSYPRPGGRCPRPGTAARSRRAAAAAGSQRPGHAGEPARAAA